MKRKKIYTNWRRYAARQQMQLIRRLSAAIPPSAVQKIHFTNNDVPIFLRKLAKLSKKARKVSILVK